MVKNFFNANSSMASGIIFNALVVAKQETGVREFLEGIGGKYCILCIIITCYKRWYKI